MEVSKGKEVPKGYKSTTGTQKVVRFVVDQVQKLLPDLQQAEFELQRTFLRERKSGGEKKNKT